MLQCSFCKREVKSTVHNQKSFRVDYYLVWTGKLIPMVMKNPRDESEEFEFFKLEKPFPLIACVDCYQKEEVQRKMESAFRDTPESTGFSEEEKDD